MIYLVTNQRVQCLRRASIGCLIALLVGACAAPAKKPAGFEEQAFKEAAPKSILVVPVVNESLEVEAGNYMLSTLPRPLAERGYYIFPVNTVQYILEQEGFYEGQQIHNQSAQALTSLFNADAVLFVKIKEWTAQYAVLATTVLIEVEYRLVSSDGVPLWTTTQRKSYTPDANQGGAKQSGLAILLTAVVQAAAAKAAPDYIPLANQANADAIELGNSPLPTGPYFVEKK